MRMIINMEHINMERTDKSDANAEILNPNCSEVVWRLEVSRSTKEAILKALEPFEEDEDDDGSIWTGDCGDDNCILDMIGELEGIEGENIDRAKFILVSLNTGEDVLEYVKECFEIAKRYKKGKITLNKAESLGKKARDEWYEVDED